MNVQFWGLVINIFYFMKFKFVGVFKNKTVCLILKYRDIEKGK